jgi:hypothetical protein
MSHPCDNCGEPVNDDQRICPRCGREQPPPLPVLEGKALSGQEIGRLLTGVAWLDIVLGIVAVFGSLFLYGIGLLAAPILYFVLRPRYPIFARGLGYGMLAFAAILLGLVAWCIAALSSGGFR